MVNLQHDSLQHKIYTELRKRGWYDYVRKEYPVYKVKNGRHVLVHEVDVAAFKMNENGTYDITAFEIKTGRRKNYLSCCKRQSNAWFTNINSSSYPDSYSTNFVVVHPKDGIYRIKP